MTNFNSRVNKLLGKFWNPTLEGRQGCQPKLCLRIQLSYYQLNCDITGRGFMSNFNKSKGRP